MEAIEANCDAVKYIRKLKNVQNTGKQDTSKSGWGNKAFNLASTFHQECDIV